LGLQTLRETLIVFADGFVGGKVLQKVIKAQDIHIQVIKRKTVSVIIIIFRQLILDIYYYYYYYYY